MNMDATDVKALRTAMVNTAFKTKYYQKLYKDIPLATTNFEDLPLANPEEYWEASFDDQNNVLSAPFVGGSLLRSSGSTNDRQKVICLAHEEMLQSSLALTKFLEKTSGLKPGDRLVDLLPYGGMSGAFQLGLCALDQISFPYVHMRIGASFPPEKIAKDIETFKGNVILGLTFTITKLVSELTEAKKTVPDVHLILFVGEPVSEGIVEMWKTAFPNAAVGPSAYGSVDTGFLGFLPHSPKTMEDAVNPIYKASPHYIIEIIDDDGRVIKEPGIQGNIITTSLDRITQPIVRFSNGDVGEWIDYKAETFRLGGRGSLAFKIEGALFELSLVRSLLKQALGHDVTGRFQPVLRREGTASKLVFSLGFNEPNKEESVRIRNELERRISELSDTWRQNRADGRILPLELNWVKVQDLVKIEASGKLRQIVDER